MTEKEYDLLLQQVRAVLEGERDLIANLANVSALLYESLPDVNWAGFYLCQKDELVLGPFQGKVACVRIAWGKGVCGSAAAQKQTVVVEDVHSFEGHIACDPASNSEIVVPLIAGGEVKAVLDIDSPKTGRFGELDRHYLEAVRDTIVKATDFEYAL